MDDDARIGGLHPGWWTAIFVGALAGIVVMTTVLFSGSLHTYVPVTLTSDRAGLVMESGAKVKMRGVPVGRVARIDAGTGSVSLELELFPDAVEHIPANVGARIRATTAFGAKYVDLIYPTDPSPQRLAPGAVLQSENTSTEVNTVFQNLVGVLHQIDPAKLNGILSALAEGVRGQGSAIGEATTELNTFLLAINARSDTIRGDWQSFKGFSDAYAGAAQNIMGTLDAASTTSTTIAQNASALDGLLLSAAGFSTSGITLLAPNQANLISAVNLFRPTADLAMKYNPELTCMLVGADWALQHGMYKDFGGNGRSAILDAGLLFGDDTYQYPENLPIVGAKGGPDGAPGCGSLPYVDKNFPVRYVVTDTGWGTGIDVRPNPGVGHPFYANYLPVTRADPAPPSVRGAQRDQPGGGPAPGPISNPGMPPYGAPLYSPDGTPLYPGLPPAPPPGSPPESGPPPAGTEPFVVPYPAQLQQTPPIVVPVPAAPSP